MKFVITRAGLAALILVSPILAIPQQLIRVDGTAERAIVSVVSDTGHGAGFLAASTGVIVTALEIIDRASRVTITTYSGEIYDTVTLLALDRSRNLAVLKINGSGLPFMEVGNSLQMKSGGQVSTFGYSFGKEPPGLLSQERVVSIISNGSGDNSIQLTAAVSETSGSVVVESSGRVMGLLLPLSEREGRAERIIASKYLRQVISSVDQTNPIFQWRGTSTTFRLKPVVGISGYWKSSKGNVYLVEDKGDRVNITNMSSPRFRYEAHWEGNLLIGIGYDDDKKRFVIRVVDRDHLLRAIFRFEKNENKETTIRRAEEKIKKPDDVWVRIQ